MAITNHERVGKALDLLKDGLRPFVERELKAQYQQGWFDEFKQTLAPQQLGFFADEEGARWDAAPCSRPCGAAGTTSSRRRWGRPSGRW